MMDPQSINEGLRALEHEISRLRSDPSYAARIANEAAGAREVTMSRQSEHPTSAPKSGLKVLAAFGLGFAAAALLLGWQRVGEAP